MIKSIEKARRVQLRRYREGKFGWARAVRRYLKNTPEARRALQFAVRPRPTGGDA